VNSNQILKELAIEFDGMHRHDGVSFLIYQDAAKKKIEKLYQTAYQEGMEDAAQICESTADSLERSTTRKLVDLPKSLRLMAQALRMGKDFLSLLCL
jgi:hypothetical protein